MNTATSVDHASTHSGHGHAEPYQGGILRWLTTTNHKDIGTMYLTFSLIMFFVGGIMILAVRAELFQPGLQLMKPEFFNQLIGVHALVMIFAALMPAATGWTLYAPLSVQGGIGVDFAIFAIHILGISSILGSINIIVTLFNLRAPGMTMMKLPLFAWGWLITAFLLIATIPVLAGAVTMLLADRHFGTHFFNAAGGGDPILFQHLFWFFGHPEVCILLLPVWGLIPHVLSTFTRKPTYGYKAQVYSFWAIGILSVVVWAHHFFTVGLPVPALLYFMYSTMAISLPLAVLFFCWIATMWRGAMTFETPMLFALGFIVLFGIGGLTGLVLADVAADAQYHHSYFVVAHFHYTLFAGGIMGVMTGVYYWLPKWTGHMFSEKLGKLHFWLTVIAFNFTFIPQFFLGLAGMPRRIPDYALQFAEFNAISSVGAFVLGLSQLIFAYKSGAACGVEKKLVIRYGKARPGWSGSFPRRRRTIPGKFNPTLPSAKTAMSEQDTAQTPVTYPADELARRRAASRRMAWLLAGVVLAIYLAGLFFKR